MTLKLVRISRLKQFAKERGLGGPVQLGEAIGRKTNQASDLINGRASFGEKIARSIEHAAGLPTGWLDEVVDSSDAVVLTQPSQIAAPPAEMLTIPQFDAGGRMGSAGLVLEAQPGVIHSWHVSPEWVHKNVRSYSALGNLCIVTGFGDSMKGMFNPGDPLLVDTGVTEVRIDAVFFFQIDGEGFIKRLQRIPGEGIRVISENKAYEPWTIKPGMDFQVLGRVLKAWEGTEL